MVGPVLTGLVARRRATRVGCAREAAESKFRYRFAGARAADYDRRMQDRIQREITGPLLRDVSRSFYLSLRILPPDLRPAISLAYLFARASDTIADTRVVPLGRRRELLLTFRRQFERGVSAADLAVIGTDLVPHQGTAGEKRLLDRLGDCFAMLATLPGADRERVTELLAVIMRGQELDLVKFPGETEASLSSFETEQELEDYAYAVAGCVGEFWTKMAMAHLRPLSGWDLTGMSDLGIRFGKGLQFTNILRDIPKDLRIGRCYIPRQRLAEVGLDPRDLLSPSAAEGFRPLHRRYLEMTLGHLDCGWRYTMAIPRSLPGLRLACAWPILIGLKTIAHLGRSKDILDPAQRVKVSRRGVYGIMLFSTIASPVDGAFQRVYDRLRREAVGFQGDRI